MDESGRRGGTSLLVPLSAERIPEAVATFEKGRSE